ncbi:Protein SDA1 [Aphelenchoides besseyi]|nr:Protein SDA1 [Aphelenchoides besseyi]
MMDAERQSQEIRHKQQQLEIQLKRQELETLRLERQQRTQNRLATSGHKSAPNPAVAPIQNGSLTTSTSTGHDLDSVLESVGIPTNRSATHLSQPSSTSNLRLSNGSLNNFAVSDASSDSAPTSRPRPTQLEMVSINVISVAPKNDNRYSKGTQTIETEGQLDGFSMGSRDEFEFDELSVGEKISHLDDLGLDDTSPEGAIAKILGRVGIHSETNNHQNDEPVAPIKPSKPPELTQEQKEKIVNSESFQRFLSRSSRWIERAIAVEKDKDIFADYTNERKDNTYSDALITSKARFNDGNYINSQMGQAIDFSEAHPELLAVAINGQSSGPEGIINIWNTNFSTATPECVFHSNSPLKSMCFAKFHPKLIIGGCSSGQICIWDLRANKRNPVNKSPISSRAHTQGVMRMQVVGSQHNHELITSSLDGQMCWWSLDNLHTPIEKLTAQFNAKKSVPISCFDFDHHDAGKFVIGGEDGCLYLGDRNESSVEKKLSSDIPAHDGSITNVDLHKTPGPVDFSRYCLTSSTDFTCKLWNLADNKNKQIFSFENKHGHYVTDVSWSPVHPAAFISTCLTGVLSLWNLNTDVDDPVATQKGGRAISQAKWLSDGKQIATLDEIGVVQLYDVHESLYNPRPNEWDVLARIVGMKSTTKKPTAVPTQLEPRNNTRVDGDNLCLLQEFLRKDPEGYEEEFDERLTHFIELSKLLQLQPAMHRMEVSPLIELTAFLASVAFCYPTKAQQFASSVMDILRAQGSALEPDLRMTFVKSIVSLRNRDQVDLDSTLELFFDLIKSDDKKLRKFILGAIVSFIRRHHRLVARVAQMVLIEAFRRGFWRDAKTANAISESIFNKTAKIQVTAIRFFLGTANDEKGIESDSDDDEEDDQAEKSRTIKEAATAFRHGKKTKKRQKQLEEAKKAITKQKKSKKEKVSQHCNLEAMRLLFDPQSLTDRLYGLLDGKRNERFALRILLMGLIARLIGVHQLQTLGFYSYLHKYLQPKQREVTRILLYAAQACHEMVPTDIVQDLVRCIAQNFVSDRNTPEAMTVGLNAIREVFVNCPFAATEELLEDLSEYKSYKDKNVSMAARGLVHLFRAVNPQVLRSKDRGRPTEATQEVMAAVESGRVTGFGKHNLAVDYVPGADILPLKDPNAMEAIGKSRKRPLASGDSNDNVAPKKRRKKEQRKVQAMAKEEKAKQVSETRILTDEDFELIREHQIKQQLKAANPKYDVEDAKQTNDENKLDDAVRDKIEKLREGDGLPRLNDIEQFHKKVRRQTKQERLEQVKEGRNDREMYKKRKKNGPHVGRTNSNVAKNKNFQMVQHKVRGKNRQRSFRDQQISLRNYLIRQTGKKVVKMESVKGGLYTDFDDFNDDVQLVLLQSPKHFRYIIKPIHEEGKIVVKVTNDIKTLRFDIFRPIELKKFEQITSRILQYMVS